MFLLLKLFDDVKFSNQPIWQTLRGNHIFSDPVWVKALDGRVSAILPIFMLAGRPSTKKAMNFCFLSKINCFHWRFLSNLLIRHNLTFDISILLWWGDCLENIAFLSGDMNLEAVTQFMNLIVIFTWSFLICCYYEAYSPDCYSWTPHFHSHFNGWASFQSTWHSDEGVDSSLNCCRWYRSDWARARPGWLRRPTF